MVTFFLQFINLTIDSIHSLDKWTDINLLFTVQLNLKKHFSDSKTFVDMSYGDSFSLIKDIYDKLSSSFVFISDFKISDRNKQDLIEFIEKYYLETGIDLIPHRPEDYKDDHSLFYSIDPHLAKILRGINKVWLSLSFQTNQNIPKTRTSLLHLPYPFMVPGQRFREFYYWDTFYLLEGLYVFEMYDTIRNIILNFAHTIVQYGYIPNGMRKYYLKRSQPPLFIPTIYQYIQKKLYRNREEKIFLLEAALKEYEWWMKNRAIDLGNDEKLNLYFAQSDYPRPESLIEDVEMFEEHTKMKYRHPPNKKHIQFFSNIKSIAESGLDFSSRWFKDGKMNIIDLIPTDLNAFMMRNEYLLYRLFSNINYSTSKLFKDRYQTRQQLMDKYLYDEESMLYYDYNYKKGELNKKNEFYITSLYPYFYGPINQNKRRRVFTVLLKYFDNIFYEGGTPVGSKVDEKYEKFGGQWDFPNVWAPHQYDLCNFLDRLNVNLGLFCAQNFFRSAYVAFIKTGLFYEKYDCNNIGSSGKGGEYIPQAGFGFTNGVLAYFIKKYKTELLNIENYDEVREKIYEGLIKEISLKSKL